MTSIAPPAGQGTGPDLLDLLAEPHAPADMTGLVCPGDHTCPSPIRHKAGMVPTAISFEAFHAANPHVYTGWLYIARMTVERTGTARLGLSQIMELVRWTLAVRAVRTDQDTDGDAAEAEYRISDSYKTFAARLSMLDDPTLEGRFFTKLSCSANLWADHQAAYRSSLRGIA